MPFPLRWIVRLRYGLIAGEVAMAVTFSLVFGIHLPWSVLVAVIGLQAVSNAFLSRRGNHALDIDALVGGALCFDTVCFTLVLGLTGGPMNPFSILYLVQISFSALVLHKFWTWSLGVFAAILFGLLFWISPEVPALRDTTVGGFSLHLLGMWTAFAMAVLLVSFFVGKVSGEVRRKEREILSMQKQLARNQRLASLVTLSAGAAHEIATPLATIAVIANEIERSASLNAHESFLEDSRLIRSQVERCRAILERMGAQGADPLGEAPVPVSLGELIDDVRNRFPGDRSRIRIRLEGAATWELPRKAAIEALAALVRNALDASTSGGSVDLTAETTARRLRFCVHDQGEGMTPEVLERVSEPFFTTKPPGKGMGLGAFLVYLFAQSMGGELSFQSQTGQGCTAVLDLPVLGASRTRTAPEIADHVETRG